MSRSPATWIHPGGASIVAPAAAPSANRAAGATGGRGHFIRRYLRRRSRTPATATPPEINAWVVQP